MKVGIVTTTINIPHAFELLARHSDEVHFFIAADEKTSEEAEAWCYQHLQPRGRVCYLTPDHQKDLGYKSSEIIGWNNDSRRNIAVLEALRAKCDFLLSVDDDMYAMSDPFPALEQLFLYNFNGLQFGAARQWFDHGQFTLPPRRARGLPPDQLHNHDAVPTVGAQIGIWQGIILGVPDADACSAISNPTLIVGANAMLDHGFVVHPQARAVVNSQWTAFVAELAPAFAQFYRAQGRNTDILAALLMRRIARDRHLYTCYGAPYAYHNRSPRPLLNDLKAEMGALLYTADFAEYLDRAPLPAGVSVADAAHALTRGYGNESLFPRDFWDAWLEDCESVL